MADPAVTLPETLSPRFVAASLRSMQATLVRGDLILDCARLRRLDSLGLAFFAHWNEAAGIAGRQLVLRGMPAPLQPRLEEMPRAQTAPPAAAPANLPERLGGWAYATGREIRDMALLFSESLYQSTLGLFRPKTLLAGSTLTQMVRLGTDALPIVLLLSMLIGFTLAMQSGLQLQKYGATLFLADGVGLSMVMEIGPVMTAVILAGRSGSAITAEIATMVVQEELAALQSMGINPIHFTALPRFWALSVTQPLLTVASCLAGIASGMGVGLFVFHLSVPGFLTELQEAIPLIYVWQGLVKSLTFSWIIVFVATTKGMNTRGGADAVGRATTACVVNCIFAIILADAVFSFLFYT